jgi:hypothetical protein
LILRRAERCWKAGREGEATNSRAESFCRLSFERFAWW